MKTLFQLKTICSLFLAFGLLMTMGCEKDDKNPDKTDLLADKAWKLTAQVANPPIPAGNGTLVTDLYAQYDACNKDDLTTFRDSGSVLFDEGGSKCLASDPQTVTGTWAFNTQETILSITLNGETSSWDIITLTADRLVVEEEFVDGGITYTITSTYSKQ